MASSFPASHRAIFISFLFFAENDKREVLDDLPDVGEVVLDVAATVRAATNFACEASSTEVSLPETSATFKTEEGGTGVGRLCVCL
jgi:hypothetical protein